MTTETLTSRLTIFQGHQRLLQADRLTVLRYLQNHDELHPGGSLTPLWVFDDLSGRRLDLNWRSELAPAAQPAAQLDDDAALFTVPEVGLRLPFLKKPWLAGR